MGFHKKMVVIRLTSSLAKKMNLKLAEAQIQSTSKLGDWYASDFRLGSKHLILCTSSIGRWPIVISAAPYKNFHERLIAELKPSLLGLGISEKIIDEELTHFNEIHYGKNVDKALVGTMVESIKTCEHYYYHNPEVITNLREISKNLAHIPHMSKVKGWPEDMTRDALNKQLLKLIK
jgi:hypothetical protein